MFMMNGLLNFVVILGKFGGIKYIIFLSFIEFDRL